MYEKEKSEQASSGDNIKIILDDDEDEIIELTNVIDLSGKEKSVDNEQAVIMEDLEEDIDSDEYVKDDFAARLGMKIESESDLQNELKENGKFDLRKEPQKEVEKFTVSPQQVEAAVERVVQRMLGDKIDNILIEVIERAVTQEIIRLKNILRVNEDDFE